MMESIRRLPLGAQPQAALANIDLSGLSAGILGFLLIVYFGLNGGGYDPLLHDQIGIAVWWSVILGLAVGALPLRGLPRSAWVALGALAAYVIWVGLSATWSSSADRSLDDLARLATYLGIFALALGLRGSKGVRRMVVAVGSGIVVIAVAGLLSRLHPAWFSNAHETVNLLPAIRGRLSYPVGYWNGLAALVAIGLPLVLYMATSARRLVVQALSAAALPALVLTLYLTFSRGGLLAAAVGLIAFFLLIGDRMRRGSTALIAAAGAAILIVAVHQRPALEEGFSNGAAQHQGNQILAMTLVVCVGVGMLQAGLALYLQNAPRPRLLYPSRHTTQVAGISLGALVLVAVVAAFATGKVSHAWNEFRESGDTGNSASRLHSFSSDGRLPYWHAAVQEFDAHPLVGGGSGSYEVWWAQHRGDRGGFVQDAHSLYLQTLAELGIVGLVLLLFFFGWVLWTGFRNYIKATRSGRDRIAAGLAGILAFTIGAGYDWLWEIPVLPVVFLLLVSVVITAGSRSGKRAVSLKLRLGLVAASVAAMVGIAIPLAAAASLQESQAAVRSGDLTGALSKAEDATHVEPFVAATHLQKALVLEEQQQLSHAEAAAREAVRAEPQEWRAWVVLSRIQAKLGKVHPAIVSYRRAKQLNPRSPLFQ
jgi:O-Antigen ligase